MKLKIILATLSLQIFVGLLVVALSRLVATSLMSFTEILIFVILIFMAAVLALIAIKD